MAYSLLCCISSRHLVSWSPPQEQGVWDFLQLLLECFVCLFILVRWSIKDSYEHICCIGLKPNAQPQIMNPLVILIKLSTTKTLSNNIPLPLLPSQSLLKGLQPYIPWSTSVVQVIPPWFHDGNFVTDFLLHNDFQLILFVACGACIGIDVLQQKLGINFSFMR